VAGALYLQIRAQLSLRWFEEGQRPVEAGMFGALRRHHLDLDVPHAGKIQQPFPLLPPDLDTTDGAFQHDLLHDETERWRW
jgi:hypothetical protein